MKSEIKMILLALYMGIAVPFLYFCIQVVSAPFYPEYSFFARDASSLGSDSSNFPSLFNSGVIIIGMVKLIAAWGFLRAFRYLGVNPITTWLTVLILFLFGLSSINAGIFPLPDPRHTTGLFAIFGMSMVLLPFLLPAALWKLLDGRLVKIYFIINIIAFIALVPVVGGLIQRWSVMTGIDLPGFQYFLNNYQGLLQRIAALIVFVPVGVSAYILSKRLRAIDTP